MSLHKQFPGTFLNSDVMTSKILSTQYSNLIGYWPMHEGSGPTASDKSSQLNHGSYTGVTLLQNGISDGKKTGSFDGSTSYLNVYSAGLNTDFNGGEVTIDVWAKTSDMASSTMRHLATFRVSDNNRIAIRKDNFANSITALYVAGGVAKTISAVISDSDWHKYTLTVSKTADAMKFYVDGQQQGTTQTGLGTWAGSLSSTSGALFGALATTPTMIWSGSIAYPAVWNVALTQTQVRNLLSPSLFTSLVIHQTNPNSISNQYSWHDFSDPTTLFTDSGKTIAVAADSDPIRVAANKFSTTDDLTAPSDSVRPLYRTNIQNSLACGLWNGVDSRLDHTVWPNADFTAFFVARNMDATNGSHIEYGNSYLTITGSNYNVPITTVRSVLHLSDPSDALSSTAPTDTDIFYIVELTKSGDSWTLTTNGGNVTTLTATSGNYWGPLAIGPEAAVGWWFDGYLAERIRYTALLDAKMRASVRYKLAEKWGIQNVSYGSYLRGD